MRFGSAWPGANFQLIDKNTEVAPDIHLLTLVSDKPGTLELREVSLAINTPEGLIIVVGCSHPGIDKIVELGTAINPHIHFIVGGFHLVTAPDLEVDRIVTMLHDRFKWTTLHRVIARASRRLRRCRRPLAITMFMRDWGRL